jgi:peptidoglycan hydrolase-like protein with peptidoglycan-binding domain
MALPVLKKGLKGEAVTRLQDGLLQLGYDPGPVDGVFGSRTQSAVKQFQRDSSLADDGIVGPKTWAALEEAWIQSQSHPEAEHE